MPDDQFTPVGEGPKGTSAGKVVFWLFLAGLGLLLVWQFFEIQSNCRIHEYQQDWQSTFC